MLEDVNEVLCCLLELAEDDRNGISATLKIILTSPKPTTRLWKVSEVGTPLLNMAAISRSKQGPSQVRFDRELTT